MLVTQIGFWAFPLVEISAYRFKTREWSLRRAYFGQGFQIQMGRLYITVWFG